MQKFFVNAQGDYLGSFDGAEPPAGAIEIAANKIPENGAQKLVGGKWSAYTKEEPITAKELSEILNTKGVLNATEIETLKVK